MKCKKLRYLGTILVIVMIGLCTICYCPHKITYTKVVKEATCFELGQMDIICERCDKVLENNTLEKIAHEFSDYELIEKPSVSGPGIEVRTCLICLQEEKREYYCPHKVTYNKIIKESSCSETGQIDTICEMCEVVVENITLEKTAHQANAKERWTYVKYATPSENGERYKHCAFCGTILSETYTILELKNNSICITGTDINHSFTISSFTQSAVDKYDIVYTVETTLGSNNPFILGHNYGTMCMLDQTKVGELIYLNINGVIEIYEVIVSEYGVLNSEQNDILGQTTGTSIWHQYEDKTLHMYTCYGYSGNGRWIVLAKKFF